MPRPKKGEPNKSEFIRKHPDLSPADLVAKAKEAGLTIATGLVYMVRGRAAAKKAAPSKRAVAKKVAPEQTAKAAPRKAAKSVEAQFIEANAGLSSFDLTAKAKKDGVGIVVVPADGATRAAKPSPAKAAGAKSRGPKPKGGGLSASDFIRSQPRETPAAEVVANGAAQDLKFSTNLVYMVRSKMGKKAVKAAGVKPATARAKPGPMARAKPGPTARAKPAPKPKAASGPKGAAGGEVTFRRLVLDLGVKRAKALVADVERKLAAILAG